MAGTPLRPLARTGPVAGWCKTVAAAITQKEGMTVGEFERMGRFTWLLAVVMGSGLAVGWLMSMVLTGRTLLIALQVVVGIGLSYVVASSLWSLVAPVIRWWKRRG